MNLAALIRDKEANFLLASGAKGESIGYAQIRYRRSMWLSASEACIEDLYVETNSRRRGVAEILIRFALKVAADSGCRQITVDTNELNVAAVMLYRKLGFACGSARFPKGKQLWFEKSL
ncbi:MAG: GNAT family N-acetyltransferase [Chloroflexi bacterium]|nr:GNAT family N-acetyltransferase [Chloroflexota bacterium]